MDQSIITNIAFTLALVLLNGFFSGAEMALISSRKTSLQERADKGSKGALDALKVIEDPTKLLATIQVGITLVGFGASATATATLAQPLTEWLRGFGFAWITSTASGLAIFLVTMAVSYVTLVLGELVPKRLGLVRAESFAILAARPVSVVERVLRPVVWFLNVSTNAVALLFGLKQDEMREGVSEEEIKMLVTEQGSLLEEEKRMIHEIFELGDTLVREVMVPRVDMMLLEDTETLSKVVDVMRGTGYSRIPIFHDDHDTVVGIAIIKDLIGPLVEGKGDDSVMGYVRKPVFVPETKGILPLLTEMQATRQQMVIVVDEYGGTAGLATTEDIVEEVVGEIADEFDPDNRYITRLSDDEYLLDGRLPIEDAQRLGIPVEESEEYETIAGWMLAEMGRIPAVGESLENEGATFRVQAMRRRRISRVRVTVADRSDEVGEEESDGQEAL